MGQVLERTACSERYLSYLARHSEAHRVPELSPRLFFFLIRGPRSQLKTQVPQLSLQPVACAQWGRGF